MNSSLLTMTVMMMVTLCTMGTCSSSRSSIDDLAVLDITLKAAALDKLVDKLVLSALNIVAPTIKVPSLKVSLDQDNSTKHAGSEISVAPFSLQQFQISTNDSHSFVAFHSPDEIEFAFGNIDIVLPDAIDFKVLVVDALFGANVSCTGNITGKLTKSSLTLRMNASASSSSSSYKTSRSSSAGEEYFRQYLNASWVNVTMVIGDFSITQHVDKGSLCADVEGGIQKVLHESLNTFISSLVREALPGVMQDVVSSVLALVFGSEQGGGHIEVVGPPTISASRSDVAAQDRTITLGVVIAHRDGSGPQQLVAPASNHNQETPHPNNITYTRDVGIAMSGNSVNVLLANLIGSGSGVLNITMPKGTMNTSILSPIWPGADLACPGCALNMQIVPTLASGPPQISFKQDGDAVKVSVVANGSPMTVDGVRADGTHVPLLKLTLDMEMHVSELRIHEVMGSHEWEEVEAEREAVGVSHTMEQQASGTHGISVEIFLSTLFKVPLEALRNNGGPGILNTDSASPTENDAKREKEQLHFQLSLPGFHLTLVETYCGHVNIPEVSSIIQWVISRDFIPTMNLQLQEQKLEFGPLTAFGHHFGVDHLGLSTIPSASDGGLLISFNLVI